MAVQKLIKMGNVVLSGIPLTNYDESTGKYGTIRPQPPATQFLNCTKLYYTPNYPIYSEIGFYKSPTSFGDLYAMLHNEIIAGRKQYTSEGADGVTSAARKFTNVDQEWLDNHAIPVTHNGVQLQINNYNMYLVAYLRGYYAAGILVDTTFYGFFPADYEENEPVISGGIACIVPFKAPTGTNLLSSVNTLISHGYILSYVTQIYDNSERVKIWTNWNYHYNFDELNSYIGDDISEITIDPDNPYDGGGTSETGGGDGSFDKDSDPVDFTPLPTLSAIGSGVAGLFSPTLSEIRSLANYLWNNELDWSQLVKLVANPIDMLISLTVVPVKPKTSTTADIKVGFISTGVSMHKCDEQYVKFNCGKLTVDRYYDSALDFAPFTKIYIYLPFIGQRELNADDVVGNDLEVEYNIDLFTGTCVAEIKVSDSVLYSFEGNVASQIPIIAESFDQLASAIIGAVATVGTVAVAAGAGAASAGATAAEGGADAAGIAAARSAGASAEFTKAVSRLASAGANTVISSKPSISHAGSASANIGLLAQKTPYLIYQIPRQSIADSYQTFNGFPSNMTATLGELSGFTQVERIHLENIPATSRELDIIEAKLKEGVLL